MGSIKQIISTMKKGNFCTFQINTKIKQNVNFRAAINISEIYGIEIKKGYSPF